MQLRGEKKIAQCKKPRIIVEDLIKTCTEKWMEIMIWPEAKKIIDEQGGTGFEDQWKGTTNHERLRTTVLNV